MATFGEGLSFETTLKTIPVTIDGKPYKLMELDGIQKGKYLNRMGSRIVLDKNGQVQSFKDYSGLETILLSACLCDESDELVKESVMQTWPSTVLSKLFDAAQELSGLNEAGRKRQEEEAKNF